MMTTLTGAPRTEPDREAGRARWAVTAVFFLNGLTLTTYLVRVPSIQADHGLSTGQLGLMATVVGVAALLAMQFVGALVARHGSATLIRATLVALPLVLVLLGLSGSFLGLCGSVVLYGAVNGTLDVAMNAHAVAVERGLARPVMSGCHAAWSVSAVTGSLVGAAVISAGVAPRPHFVGAATVVGLAGLVIGRLLLPAAADRAAVHHGARADRPAVHWHEGWSRSVIALGLVGTVLMICEGAALAWSGVYLHDTQGASLTLASVAVTAFTAGQTGVRLVGDRLTMRFGPAVLFRLGALIGTAGFALAVLSPRPIGAVAGFAIVGLGTSLLLPLTFSAVGHAGGTGPGAAVFVARFTTFTYAGILLGPALIGWVGQGIGLQWTLALLVPLLGAVALFGRLPARPA